MSGGHFDYQQYRIRYIADDIQDLIDNNDTSDYPYSKKTINKFKEIVDLLRKSEIMAQRVDWLVSGDDSEESFHVRLKEDLEEYGKQI